MNEKIVKLAEQAGAETWSRAPMRAVTGLAFTDENLEKFAELIVRECIDKITTYDLVPGHSAKWEDIYDIHARLLQDLGEELKEHFGVGVEE
jgi:wyosine [tRNA(Phe)-imidazoG37] synthetase (radical SAM superfamily)